LVALHRGNFFVVPLDDKRQWYRYHHLFGEVLSVHLRAEQPEQVSTLHRRASLWYEQHGSIVDAIRHAMAAEDFERAAFLVERAVPALSRSRQQAVLFGWLKSLPDELLHVRPVLSVAYAHMSLDSGEFDRVEDLLRDAEQWLDTAAEERVWPQRGHSQGEGNPRAYPAAEMVVVDDEAFLRLPGAIAVARAGQALALGDVPSTIHYAQQVLDVALEDDHLSRGGGAAFLGLASWASGDLEVAHRMYAEGMAHLQMAGNISDAINGAITLAHIRIAQGHLREAMHTYERGLRLATVQHRSDDSAQRMPGTRPVLRGTADIYVGMSELHHEHNELHAATQHLLRSTELGEHAGFPQNRYRRCVAMARLREVEGDLQGALDLLDEAERLYVDAFSPNVCPVAALKTRVWLAQGRLEEALGWAREKGLSAHDDLSYPREFEHITLARVLLARSTTDRADQFMQEAIGLLHRLLEAAEQGERAGSLIEILIVQALAYWMQGNIRAALVPLERALTLAEPEGYVRMFVDEGQAMVHLLMEAAARGIKPDYTGTLLAALGVGQPPTASAPPLPPSLASPSPFELLSERELDVLRLFKTELSGPEIAQKLMIALSTVRTHTKSIYSKLDVTSRRAAVHRAAELDLI
jgi:LuxR family maltose regulon positive regulatory protein